MFQPLTYRTYRTSSTGIYLLVVTSHTTNSIENLDVSFKSPSFLILLSNWPCPNRPPVGEAWLKLFPTGRNSSHSLGTRLISSLVHAQFFNLLQKWRWMPSVKNLKGNLCKISCVILNCMTHKTGKTAYIVQHHAGTGMVKRLMTTE